MLSRIELFLAEGQLFEHYPNQTAASDKNILFIFCLLLILFIHICHFVQEAWLVIHLPELKVMNIDQEQFYIH